MIIQERSVGDVVVVAADGRLDSNTSGPLEEILSERARSRPALIVDLTAVAYVSSAGLRVLLKAAKLTKAGKNRLALVGLAAPVKEVFDISGFTPIFQIFDDLDTAVAALA